MAGKHEGTVLGLGIGCFGELPAGFNDVCTFIARNRAVSYADRYDDKSSKEALGMFRSRNRRAWGHTAIFAWSDLILDRSRKLAGLRPPAACATCAGGELELIQPHMAQKPVLRGEVGCACVAREISVERGGMGERGCARRLGGWVWL